MSLNIAAFRNRSPFALTSPPAASSPFNLLPMEVIDYIFQGTEKLTPLTWVNRSFSFLANDLARRLLIPFLKEGQQEGLATLLDEACVRFFIAKPEHAALLQTAESATFPEHAPHVARIAEKMHGEQGFCFLSYNFTSYFLSFTLYICISAAMYP